MSLSWNLEKIRDWKEISENDNEWAVTETLIWDCMAVEIGTITEKNAAEFYARVRLLEQLYGCSLGYVGEDGKRVDRPITPEDVERRIGLSTNVGSAKARSTFYKKIGRELDDNVRHYNYEMKKKADEQVST
jgi:hypothetical protein